MDWKRFAERFDSMTCILSVEKKPDGGCGAVRIVTGNDRYLDSLALAAGGVDMHSDKKAVFVPNSEYTRYIPKDLNFEDVCFRCAVQKQPIHNCVRASRYPFDIMAFFQPLQGDEADVYYCAYTQVLLKKDDDNLLSLNISQETAMEVIGTCIKLREDKPFDEIMQAVIEDVRTICDADYCSVLLLDESLRRCSVLGEARAPGSEFAWMEKNPDDLDEDFFDLAETWLDTMAGSFCLVIRDANDMEFIRQRNPKWYQSLVCAGVERLVLYPLIPRGQFLGYIMAVNFDTENTQHIKDTLELTTYFIASEIANNRFIDQLKALNATDLLTGVMNRNALNARLAGLSEAQGAAPCRMGVVFADMNSLKYVNDHLGHVAGDTMLKNAAMILQSTFAGEEIYRGGGDEFLVLLRDTDEADVRAKIADIKMKSELFENVSFAAGYCLLTDSRDIRAAFSEADAMMYRDKEAFYRQHPEMKRS
ncbi:MAG: sensor domain-containing diguanylate cyclase [Clostridia bacterium]|nr:sensor domain-containing diguanylate cyclase [Clostridia bacterium]